MRVRLFLLLLVILLKIKYAQNIPQTPVITKDIIADSILVSNIE